MLKRQELGLNSASLGRTYDDLMLVSGVTLPLLQTELVRRESHDDLERYQAFMAQERGAENVKKPQHPTASDLVKELLAQQATESSNSEFNVVKEVLVKMDIQQHRMGGLVARATNNQAQE